MSSKRQSNNDKIICTYRKCKYSERVKSFFISIDLVRSIFVTRFTHYHTRHENCVSNLPIDHPVDCTLPSKYSMTL